jgi:primary-amine oxidase
MAPHPLDPLTIDEINIARDVILNNYADVVVDFREIYLQEPAKTELLAFLREEHSGSLGIDAKRPVRLAKCQYDVIGTNKMPEFHECAVDIDHKEVLHREVVDVVHHASLTL